jgi:hypothetical protein
MLARGWGGLGALAAMARRRPHLRGQARAAGMRHPLRLLVTGWHLAPHQAAQVIEPVRSRCLCIRVAAPTQEQVAAQLQAVAAQERLVLPPALAQRLAEASERNLRRALLSLEACRVQRYPFDEGQEAAAPDWELYIRVRAPRSLACSPLQGVGGWRWGARVAVSYLAAQASVCVPPPLPSFPTRCRSPPAFPPALAGDRSRCAGRAVSQATPAGAWQAVRAAYQLRTTRGECVTGAFIFQ